MKSWISTALLAFLLAGPCAAAGMELMLLGDPQIESPPKNEIVQIIRVTNPSLASEELHPLISVPEGWRILTGATPFRLAPKESTITLVTVAIPSAAAPGNYSFRYQLPGAQDGAVPVVTREIIVLPERRVEMVLLEAPGYVVAGESFEAVFSVTNGSNERKILRVNASEKPDFSATLEWEEGEFEAGEIRRLTVKVSTSNDLRRPVDYWLRLKASLEGAPSVTKEAFCRVQVLPLVTQREDPFLRAQGYVTVRTIAQKDLAEPVENFWQGEVAWDGALDDHDTRHVTMFYRGPDVKSTNSFSLREEMFLDYRSESLDVTLGDFPSFISPLLTNDYGRGVKGTVRMGRFFASSFYQESLFLHPKDARAGGSFGAVLGENIEWNLHYWQRKAESLDQEVGGVQAELRPWDPWEIRLAWDVGREIASGQSLSPATDNQAFFAEFTGRHAPLTYNLRYTKAGKKFPGIYGDRSFLTASISAVPVRNVSMWAGSSQGTAPLDANLTYDQIPLERTYSAGMSYRFPTATSVSFDYRGLGREEKNNLDTIDYQEKTYRVGLGQAFFWGSVDASGDFGTGEDVIAGEQFTLRRYNLSSSARISERQTLNASMQLYKETTSDHLERTSATAALRWNSRLRDNLRWRLEVARREHRFRSFTGEYLGRTNLVYTFRNHHSLSFTADYRTTGFAQANSVGTVSAGYTIPFSLPLGRKQNLGSVEGRVVDPVTKAPYSGVILQAGGATAVTDSQGRFSFPSLKPGSYPLEINTNRLGAHYLPAPGIPAVLVVKGGSKETVEIPVTGGGRLTGQVVLYKLAGGFGEYGGIGKEEYEPAGTLETALVELGSDQVTYRRLTDAEGRFDFEEIPPGSWTLRLVVESLPPYHRVEYGNPVVEIRSGETQEALIKVLPVKRKIQWVEKGVIISEDTSGRKLSGHRLPLRN